MTTAGFDLVPGEHPIMPVMLGDAALADEIAERLLDQGVYVIGFSFPVVPKGKARIRTQMCAGHDAGSSTGRSRRSSSPAASSESSAERRSRTDEGTGQGERAPGIWLEEMPEPKVGANDVLIRIRKTAICGTDIHIYNWDAWAQKTIPVPMAVGHEYFGEIVEIGSEVQGSRSATASRARVTSPAATAATAAPAAATCAATPSASASTARAASPSTS